jgi:hypothetical protein
VVIARQGARELAERDGLAGIQSALGELVSKVPGATVAEGEPAEGGSDVQADEATETQEAAAE